jgi:hypothetical protein
MAKRLSTRNIRYILTPEGMNELAHRSYHYMRRTFTEVQECAAAVEAHIMQAKALGIVGECADSAAAERLGETGCVSVYEMADREEQK